MPGAAGIGIGVAHGKAVKPQKARRPRVLLADDDGLTAHAIERALRSWGYDVAAVVASGREALESARTQRPELAILDVAMPEPDGLTVARQLVEEHGVRVILISGYGRLSLLARALDLNVACLRKPVQLTELRAALAGPTEARRPRSAHGGREEEKP